MQRSSRRGLKLYRRKKVYPKQYNKYKSFMKIPVPRSLIDLDTTSVKCEFFNSLIYANAGTQPIFQNTSLSYINVAAVLINSVTFQDMVTRYGRYKITGMSLRFDATLDSVGAGNLDNHYPPIGLAFYPQIIGSPLGTAILANDAKAYFGSSITVPQTKYWRFPDQFFDASAGGYGVWNNSSSYSSITGQISLASPISNITANAQTILGEVKFVLYVLFSSKNQ